MLRTAHLGALVALALAACDPVHDQEQAALGGETPGVRTGPLHRPGQPCTVCHDGKLGSPPEFSVAGTIYADETGLHPASKAVVTLTSSDGKAYQATTNAAGNFYVEPGRFTPQYPMKTEVAYGGVTIKMTSLIGRAGACAGCHVNPAGPTSPGPIFVPADGVIP